MVVRTGNIELVVSDVTESLDVITLLATENGGYVVTSQRWKEGERNIGSISIRVLAANYDKTVSALREMAESVVSESTSSQDVTEEYVDLDSKVKNLEASEAQLLKIMENASIQRELTNVRGQIEQAKGRMQYLERTSSTSLIQIKLNEAAIDLKFSANTLRIDSGKTIVFTSEVSGGFGPYSYQWDFGDGETSIEKSPSHSYEKEGVYSVTLKVTDDKGYTASLDRQEYITVIGGWSPGNIAGNAWSGFTAFGRGLVDVLIYIGIFSPVWIVIGIIVGLIIYFRKRKRNT
jgi:PKD repeat protein